MRTLTPPKNRTAIGDVIVTLSGAINPYKSGLMGLPRVLALRAFYEGYEFSEPAFDFWIAPACGGARKIQNLSEINWETMDRDNIGKIWFQLFRTESLDVKKATLPLVGLLNVNDQMIFRKYNFL